MTSVDPETAFEPTALTSHTGARLALRSLPSIGAARGIVQINHGAAEHSGRYFEFAQKLAVAGYHVFVHDHRGHGLTEVPGAAPHTFGGEGGWNQLVTDIGAVHAYIQSIYETLPRIILGHSMGSIAAFDYMLRNPDGADAMVLLGPTLAKNPMMGLMKGLLGLEARFRDESSKSSLFQALAWDPLNKPWKKGRTPYDWLSRDEQEVDAYIADPECGWPPTMNFAQELAKGLSGTFEDYRLEALPEALPILLMSGSQDTSTNFGKSVPELKKRLKKAGLNDIETHIFPGMRHELHNELDRDEVYDTLIEWCHSKI